MLPSISSSSPVSASPRVAKSAVIMDRCCGVLRRGTGIRRRLVKKGGGWETRFPLAAQYACWPCRTAQSPGTGACETNRLQSHRSSGGHRFPHTTSYMHLLLFDGDSSSRNQAFSNGTPAQRRAQADPQGILPLEIVNGHMPGRL
jgi:hypothetical protein